MTAGSDIIDTEYHKDEHWEVTLQTSKEKVGQQEVTSQAGRRILGNRK